MQIVAGDQQSAPVGTELPTPLVARVMDAQGRPVRGQAVNFRVTAGGGSVFAGVANSNDSGVVRERWTLGTSTADSQRIEARAVDNVTGAPLTFATFRATAVAGAAATLKKASSDSGWATVATAVTSPPSVKVVDRFDNPVSGTAVVFAVASGGGAVTGANQTSDASGLGTVGSWTLGATAGPNTLTATATGLTGSPMTFTATGTAGTASQLVLTTSAAGAASGAAFTTQPVLAIRDAAGNTVTTDNNTVVTMTVSTGATVVGTATATATSGVATFTNVGISGTAGTSYTLTFSRSGVTSATQSITPTVGSATQLVLTTNAAGAASGAAFTTQPVVAVRDAAGNTVTSDNSSVVTMTVSTGASAVGNQTATASSGVATFANAGIHGTAGTGYTLTFSKSGLTSATQSITPTVGSASQLVLTRNAAGAASGAAFTTQPIVAVRDAAGNTVTSDNSSVVTMTVSGGATVVGTATATASSGLATFGYVGISGTAGTSYTLTFSTSGLASATQSITPTAGALATVTVSPSSDSLTAAQTQQLTAVLRDASGNTVSGATVTWSSSNTAVATVSASGQVTAVAVGTATITATSNGKTGTATITVLAFTFTALTAGLEHTCGWTSTGAAYCWGGNGYGQLGDGTTTQRLTPVPVHGGLVFTALTAGYHTCGLTSAGAAYCWGKEGNGWLPDGTEAPPRLTPVAVQGGLVFTALTAGMEHTCGLTSAGAAYCWGSMETFGGLGDGTWTDRLTPVAVQGGLVFTALTAGAFHTCGLTSAGAAYCWGYNAYGQLGDGTGTNRLTPVAVQAGFVFTALKAGTYHTCGLTSAGAAYCWGRNYEGELGDGTTTQRLTPVAVQGGLVFTALSGGNHHTCGLTSAGTVYCWGYNNYGQLGDGTTTQRLTPVAVQGGLVFQSLTAGGGDHTCGLTSAGAAYCWGSNGYGQLGDGTTTQRLTPVAVVR